MYGQDGIDFDWSGLEDLHDRWMMMGFAARRSGIGWTCQRRVAYTGNTAWKRGIVIR